ncbi:MAG: hypothetical protein JXB05_33535 [Myxococcaceae bacterium]|nr:hypothetical protein [Myxococcaceae bacterium]
MNRLTLVTGQQDKSFFTYARVLATQILYLTPVFWLLELTQNQLFRIVQGEWGWIYPSSPYQWFSFASLLVWALGIGVMWTLHYYWFYPRRVAVWRRVAYGTIAAWGIEWAGGFVHDKLLGTPLQVWPGSPLVYVSFGAIFFWMSNIIIYHLLTVSTVDLTPDYDAPEDARNFPASADT